VIHQRKCWDCGNVAGHESDVVPGVLCKRCGSQDTRRTKNKSDTKYVPAEILLALIGIDLSDYAEATKAIDGVFDRFGIKHVLSEEVTVTQ